MTQRKTVLSLLPETGQSHNNFLVPSLISGGTFTKEMFYMIITIGTTSDDKRVLHKSWAGRDITVQLKQPCDVLNPVFVLGYDKNLISANYLHCPELNRYYFIDNIALMPGKRMELHCSVDVLMSYSADIDNINVVVARQENAGLTLMTDTSIMIKNYAIIDTYPFPEPFNVAFGSYVMQVIGG